jgi:integrase
MFESPRRRGWPIHLEGANTQLKAKLAKHGVAWHGWHAFRRGLATNLHSLGVQDKVTQSILRHSNVAVTQACYIKTVSEDSAAAMKLLEAVLCTQSAPATAASPAQRLN